MKEHLQIENVGTGVELDAGLLNASIYRIRRVVFQPATDHHDVEPLRLVGQGRELFKGVSDFAGSARRSDLHTNSAIFGQQVYGAVVGGFLIEILEVSPSTQARHQIRDQRFGESVVVQELGVVFDLDVLLEHHQRQGQAIKLSIARVRGAIHGEPCRCKLLNAECGSNGGLGSCSRLLSAFVWRPRAPCVVCQER